MAELLTETYKPKLSEVEASKLFNELHQKIESEGLLRRDYLRYAILAIMVVVMLSLLAGLIYLVNNYFLLFVFAVLFGITLGQVSGYMHDAGHRGILKSNFWNDVVGFFSACILFINYNDWKMHHDKHHAFPNQHGKDPDLNQMLFSFTKETAKSLNKFWKTLLRYQAILFYPMSGLLVYSFHFRTNILRFINEFKKKNIKGAILETLALVPPFFMWYILPFLLFSPLKALLLVIVVPITLGFYMANIFAPNHKGMPQIKRDVHISFLERQIITARNLKPGSLTNFFYIGLNYQIEHHLFPAGSRHRYEQMSAHVKALCERVGLEYRVNSIIESSKLIIGNLQEIAQEADSIK